MQWRSEVEDAAGRTREVVVTQSGKRVTVQPPPGEGFSMSPDQADLLMYAIETASNLARRSQ